MDDPELVNGYYAGEQEFVYNQNWIRLHHVLTNVTVAVHNKNKSLIATKMNLVYGYPYVSTLKTHLTKCMKSAP